MEIVGLQWNLVWEDKEANFARARALLEAASPQPGALVVLPEMFATGFSMNAGGIGEEPGGETERFLASLARAHKAYLLGGVVGKASDGRGRNEAVAFSPAGKEIARYCKMHPFRPAGEGESYHAGSTPVLWKWHEINVAPFVCYDLRFPEIFRLAVAEGAEVFPVIANWPAARLSHWRALLRARAIENQAYVIGINRCGNDPKIEYPGSSLAVDPTGAVLAELGAEEGVLRVEVAADVVRDYRASLPFLSDLRSDILRPDTLHHRGGG